MNAEASNRDTDGATDRQASPTPHLHSAAAITSGRAKSQDAKAVDTYRPEVRSISLRHCLSCSPVAAQANEAVLPISIR